MAIIPSDPNCAAEAAHFPDQQYVPAGNKPESGTPPAKIATPMMGLHGKQSGYIPRTTTTSPRRGSTEVPQPQAFQHSGYFPTFYRIQYDSATDVYNISLDGMKMHQAG